MIQKIQKFGAAMLAPVLLFAFSGMIVGISVLFTNQQIFGSLAAEGTLWLQFWTIVNKGAWTVFNRCPCCSSLVFRSVWQKKNRLGAAWRRWFST